LLVDTGCHIYGIIDLATAKTMNHSPYISREDDRFGDDPDPSGVGKKKMMEGYVMKIGVPEIGFEEPVPFRTSRIATEKLRRQGFDGMIGLPLLQRLLYGGDSFKFFFGAWKLTRKRVRSERARRPKAETATLTRSGVERLSASLGHESEIYLFDWIKHRKVRKVNCPDGPVYVIKNINEVLLKTMTWAYGS
jgi:hypothetical protein